MYPVSSQKKNWTFSDELEIEKLRKGANERFIEKFGRGKTVTNSIASFFFEF